MARGRKTGGRQKGTPNKVTAEMRAEITETGETPLEYMIRIMRDEEADPSRRDDMAKAAAPYLHPRLSNVDQSVNTRARYVISDKPMSAEEWKEKFAPEVIVERFDRAGSRENA